MMIIALTLFLALLQIADWHTTRTILANGGHEQNPVSAWCMRRVSVDGFLIFKGCAVTALGYFVGTHSDDLLAGIIVIYCVVIYHNLKSMP